MATVVTTEQLSQVATAQKNYIDTKDTAINATVSANKTEIEGKLTAAKEELEGSISDNATAIEQLQTKNTALEQKVDALDIPEAAGDDDLKDILDIFSTGQE